MTSLTVLAVGPQALVEDLGRPGRLGIGVAGSGALDAASLRAANRLVGNPDGAAGVEVLLGGLRWRADAPVTFAVTGAPAPLWVEHRPVAFAEPCSVAAGATITLGTPVTGLRSYLAVRGGLAVPAVLGSRSTDTSSGLGPPPLQPGDRLPIGPPPQRAVEPADAPKQFSDVRQLVLDLGPRHDLLTRSARTSLTRVSWRVSADTDRIGVRLDGPALTLTSTGELPSAPILPGAVQVPPSGQPVIFLVDHPTTGGYPVIGCVRRADVALLGQSRPGSPVRLSVRENRV